MQSRAPTRMEAYVHGPGQHNLQFFVYIVESPSAPDLYHGRSEGNLVERALSLDAIPCVARTTIDPTAFIAALRIGLPEAMKAFPDRLPILHLSMHGGMDGIQLSNGSVIDWPALREVITPICRSLDGALLLCMSACEGYHACQMAMCDGNDPHPYWGIVGNFGKPTWSDTAVAYSAFYHLLSKGYVLLDAVEAMKVASGDNGWVLETAEESKQAYIRYSSVNLTCARAELQDVAVSGDVSPAAKALETGTTG